MKKTEWLAVLILVLLMAFMMTGCNTVAGVGKDIQGSAEWTKEKMAEPSKSTKADK